jgi:hypothetical protein
MADISKRIKTPRRERGDYALKTAAYDLKNSESGTVFQWDSTTAFNFNLPRVRPEFKGVFYDFVINTAASSGTGHGVSPDSNDKIIGCGLTAADNKDVYFATAGDAVGNGFRLVSDGLDGWVIFHLNGTLSREA